jgi:hypothetical protein
MVDRTHTHRVLLAAAEARVAMPRERTATHRSLRSVARVVLPARRLLVCEDTDVTMVDIPHPIDPVHLW